MSSLLSLGQPFGPTASTCGYCAPPGRRSTEKSSIHVANLEAIQLSNDVYQSMIDRGWRRSGTWCYKPHMRATCCPQYTIRLDVSAFKVSKSHKKLVNRWNRFIQQGFEEEHMDISDTGQSKAKSKGRNNAPFDLTSALRACEHSNSSNHLHKLEVTLEPSSYTREKYELYEKYQLEIHHDEEKHPSGFKRFLVDSPLRLEQIAYPSPPADHLPKHYGSYHQLYKLDGKLIAMGVVDILPRCISSVYFMYDKDCERFSLGKLSALREVTLAKGMKDAGAPDMGYLYMGYYIHSCQKMRYKGDYSPSFLADPDTYTWYPLDFCRPLLDKNRFASFSQPELSLHGPPTAEQQREALVHEPEEPDNTTLDNIRILKRITPAGQISLCAARESQEWEDQDNRRTLLCCMEDLGEEVAREMIFMF